MSTALPLNTTLVNSIDTPHCKVNISRAGGEGNKMLVVIVKAAVEKEIRTIDEHRN